MRLMLMVCISLVWLGSGCAVQPPPQPAIVFPGRNNARFEAREWLKHNPNSSALAGNRFGTTEDALAFVETLYAAGAVEVYVTAILDEEWRIQQEGGPYADVLIVTLPDDAQKREHLFRIEAEEAADEGFDPTTDAGQDELLFWWD